MSGPAARATIAFAAGILSILLAAGRVAAGESAEAMFVGAGVSELYVSPNGNWIAADVRRDDESLVVVQRVGLPTLVNLVRADWIARVAWEGPETLIVEALTSAGLSSFHFFRLSLAGDEIVSSHRRLVVGVNGKGGTLVDALPFLPEKVLWLFPGTARYGWTSVHRISIDELIDYRDIQHQGGITIEIAEKLAIVRGSSGQWIAQRDGTPRAALRRGDGFTALMMPALVGNTFRTVYRFDDDEAERAVIPVGLTADERAVLVLAYAGKDTNGLYEWDDAAGAVGREVFVHPDYDLTGVLHDPLTGDLVAAVYEDAGERKFHYFDAYRARYLERLPEAWRKDSIAILNGSADRQVLAFLDASADNPGDFYVRDRAGVVHRIGRLGENVDRSKLSPVESFRVKAKDDVEVEAYLTRPKSSPGKAPLVVMPHGGPIGVRDRRTYDPLNQYLASWGFAVLQVNYRGSSGRGIEFTLKGRKEWARGIEDDIDAAVERAMDLPGIDRDRLCIVGASYGGFSAFASVIRHRDRYRCAVSVAGVSDVPLLYDSSDVGDSERAVDAYREYVGDVETERDRLIEISPAYHVREISVPTLIIQGAKDRRVDPDHAHRMALMFELYGKPYELLEIEDAGHSFDRDQAIIEARTVRRFLTDHLLPEVGFERDPNTRWDR